MSTTEPTPVAPAAKKSFTRFITPTLAGLALLGAGVVGGVLIGQSSASASGPGGASGLPGGGTSFGGEAPAGDGAAAGMPGGVSSGTIVSNDGSTIVIETEDGEQLTITVGEASVSVTTEAEASSLAVGDEITVVGEEAEDGSISASSISQGGLSGGFGGGAGGFGGGTAPGAGGGAGSGSEE